MKSLASKCKEIQVPVLIQYLGSTKKIKLDLLDNKTTRTIET